MMNIHTRVTDNTIYTMLLTPWRGVCQSTLSNLMMNIYICVTDYTTYHMVYVRLMVLSTSFSYITCQYHLQMTSYAMLYVRSIWLT
jgi:hypothetical protein